MGHSTRSKAFSYLAQATTVDLTGLINKGTEDRDPLTRLVEHERVDQPLLALCVDEQAEIHLDPKLVQYATAVDRHRRLLLETYSSLVAAKEQDPAAHKVWQRYATHASRIYRKLYAESFARAQQDRIVAARSSVFRPVEADANPAEQMQPDAGSHEATTDEGILAVMLESTIDYHAIDEVALDGSHAILDTAWTLSTVTFNELTEEERLQLVAEDLPDDYELAAAATSPANLDAHARAEQFDDASVVPEGANDVSFEEVSADGAAADDGAGPAAEADVTPVVKLESFMGRASDLQNIKPQAFVSLVRLLLDPDAFPHLAGAGADPPLSITATICPLCPHRYNIKKDKRNKDQS